MVRRVSISISQAVIEDIFDKQGMIDLCKEGNAQKQEGLPMAEPPRSRGPANCPHEAITPGNRSLGQVVIDNDMAGPVPS